MARLGIIAGGGVLPQLLAEHCRSEAQPYAVYAIANVTGDWARDHSATEIPLNVPAQLFTALQEDQCTEVCMVGSVVRPSLHSIQSDDSELMASLQKQFAKGDDGLLRQLAAVFEMRGYRVVGVQDRLPTLLTTAGPLVGAEPSVDVLRDIDRGREIVRAIGELDIGQAAVVAEGRCLGVEASDGTEALLRRVADMDVADRAGARVGTGVLVKAPKPGQDHRFDLPAIGPDTIAAVARAGLAGVAIEADGVLVLERERVMAEAQAADLFIFAFPKR